jgi:hypothetical protein
MVQVVKVASSDLAMLEDLLREPLHAFAGEPLTGCQAVPAYRLAPTGFPNHAQG